LRAGTPCTREPLVRGIHWGPCGRFTRRGKRLKGPERRDTLGKVVENSLLIRGGDEDFLGNLSGYTGEVL